MARTVTFNEPLGERRILGSRLFWYFNAIILTMLAVASGCLIIFGLLVNFGVLGGGIVAGAIFTVVKVNSDWHDEAENADFDYSDNDWFEDKMDRGTEDAEENDGNQTGHVRVMKTEKADFDYNKIDGWSKDEMDRGNADAQENDGNQAGHVSVTEISGNVEEFQMDASSAFEQLRPKMNASSEGSASRLLAMQMMHARLVEIRKEMLQTCECAISDDTDDDSDTEPSHLQEQDMPHAQAKCSTLRARGNMAMSSKESS